MLLIYIVKQNEALSPMLLQKHWCWIRYDDTNGFGIPYCLEQCVRTELVSSIDFIFTQVTKKIAVVNPAACHIRDAP